jgi:hypothetical protein
MNIFKILIFMRKSLDNSWFSVSLGLVRRIDVYDAM